ncbi:MAG: AAA family ATPase [Myxococcota bacterium]
MLQRLTISGLGPHREFSADFNPTGRTLVTGPSESGKSFLLEAITFCLWGRTHGGKFPTEAISDGLDKVTVELLLDSGRLIRRSATPSSQRRSISMGEDTQTFTSEAAFAEALGDLGRDTDVLRLVIVPFDWVKLVEGNARPFRDILTRILPEMDVGAEVARVMAEQGFPVEPGEATLGEKEVMSLRSDARKARDEAAGRLASARERLDGLATSEPRPEAGAVDPALLDAAERWAAFDRTAGNGSVRAAAEAAQQAWDRRAAELGAEPVIDPVHGGAAARHQLAQATAAQATQAYQQAFAQQQTALAQMQQFHGGDPSVCPTCQRSGWLAGMQYVQQLQTFQAQIQGSFEIAQARWAEANAELQRATEAVNAAREAELRLTSWHGARKSLGQRPALPELPAGAPEPPAVPRPEPEAVARATAAARESAAFDGAHRLWQSNHQQAAATVARETERHDAAPHECLGQRRERCMGGGSQARVLWERGRGRQLLDDSALGRPGLGRRGQQHRGVYV